MVEFNQIHSNLQVVMNNRVNAYQRPHNKEEDGDKDMTVDECVLKGTGINLLTLIDYEL